jgi:hypothetical protein
MEVKNPVHPGVLVAECLDDLGLSVRSPCFAENSALCEIEWLCFM